MVREDDPAVGAPQRSAEWFAQRSGKATASRFVDIVAKLKSGPPAKAREDYLWELVVERLTGSAADHFASAAMQWGNDNEARARMAYEAHTGALVEEVGFVIHPELPDVGGSPDGLIDTDGGLEMKCPFNSAVHLLTIILGMPTHHRAQVQGLMWITGRAWWDFVSFDPRLPEPFDKYIQRIPRDQKYIDELALEVTAFLADVDTQMKKLHEAVAP